MDDTPKKLEEIAEKLDDFSTRMNDEARVMEEELANRKRLGLKGDAAIKHYNEWIDRHGMGHLQVPYLSRLGRNVRKILDVTDDLTKAGINIHILDLNIDTLLPDGKENHSGPCFLGRGCKCTFVISG